MDFKMSTVDRQSKASSTTMNVNDAATEAELQALINAMDAVILGSDIKGVAVTSEVVDGGSAVPPADDNASRERKWLLRLQDSTNQKIFTYELGTADNTQLPAPTTDYLDLTATTGLALKTAIEVVWRSPYGNAGVLLSVQEVHRNG